jgi:hypothetical protein
MSTALFVNDYSFHGQFSSPDEVIEAIRGLRSLHAVCREHSVECFCSRFVLGNREAIGEVSLRDSVLRHPNPDARRLVLSWIDRHGPYWDTARLHDGGDWYFAVQGGEESLVTDSAVAECTARMLFRQQTVSLLSATPSDFTYTPVIAGIREDENTAATCELPNHWDEPPLRHFLGNAIAVSNWVALREYAVNRFPALVFTADAFDPILRSPFSVGLRDRIIELLDVLNRISNEIRWNYWCAEP